MQEAYQSIVSRAWSDAEFKARLLASPAEVLGEFGLVAPQGATCRVVEDTATCRHLVLPQPPAARALTEDDLDQVAGGGGDVQLSPNVINAFNQINANGALQFDVPAYAARNVPIGDAFPNAQDWNSGPQMWHSR